MADIFAEKRRSLEALLREMEGLREAVREGRFDDLDGLALRQSEIIKEVEALDRGHEQSVGPGKCPRERAEELKILIARIEETNKGLIVTVTDLARGIQQDLGALHRGVEAAAGYRRQADVKI